MKKEDPPPAGHTLKLSTSSLKQKTGRTWKEWFEFLDGENADKKDHKDIVRLLAVKGSLESAWHSQMVASTYETERGIKEKHQKPDGYEISVSKTLSVPVAVLFRAWEEDTRKKWLSDPGFRVSTFNPEKSIRGKWIDGVSRIDVSFYDKGGEKSQVVVQHRKIPTRAEAENMKKYWKLQLKELAGLISGNS